VTDGGIPKTIVLNGAARLRSQIKAVGASVLYQHGGSFVDARKVGRNLEVTVEVPTEETDTEAIAVELLRPFGGSDAVT
jgi:hypothetical protein